MANTLELNDIYKATLEAAELIDAPCDRDKVWSALSAYEEGFTAFAVAFRTTTKAARRGELSVRYIVPTGEADLYQRALDNGFVTETDHPASRLYREARELGSMALHGVDVGAASGFEKIWCIYPDDIAQPLETVCRIPSLPRSVGDNLEYFTRHGLTEVTGIAIDYHNQSVNIYFPFTGDRDAAAIARMVDDLGLPPLNPDDLESCRRAFSVYFTVAWSSPRIERVCFPIRAADRESLPVHLGPLVDRFVSGVPFSGEDRAFVYAVTASRQDPYYKIENLYYRSQAMIDADART